jgi:hypothetical protein
MILRSSEPRTLHEKTLYAGLPMTALWDPLGHCLKGGIPCESWDTIRILDIKFLRSPT